MATRRTTLAIIPFLALAAVPAFAQTTAYTASFTLYRVHQAPIDLLRPDEVNASLDPKLEGRLDSPITVAFEDVHILEIFQFLHEIYELDFEFDEGTVAPPKKSAAGYVSDGMVQYIHLKDVNLRDALNAILAPLNLDYYLAAGKVRIRKASGQSPSDSARQHMVHEYLP